MLHISHQTTLKKQLVWAGAGLVAIGAVIAISIGLTIQTHAIGTGTNVVYVTPSDTQGWTSAAPLADTRANGSVSFVADANTPYGTAALRLATGDNTVVDGQMQDKVQYMKAANMPLSSITGLGYSTKQVAASFTAGLPSFQLPVCLEGFNTTTNNCNVVPGTTQSSFTTLVYEPYIDQGNTAVLQNTWQTWNVSTGKLWSSRTVDGLVSTQGSTTYLLSDLQAQFPNATLLAFGVDVGSNNPNYDTRVDGVVVNNTLYDFELTAPVTKPVPTDKNQCKDGGWMNLFETDGSAFKNQGQCVSYVMSDRQ
ncbi:MAG TPA: hypothetical protein VN081_05530 [Dongiaceae bacterium]|nr:hypothetical protein [Dongiaceae bacterium]